MKCKKIALLGCGAIFFVAAAQLISCGGGGGGGTYSVTLNSDTLKINVSSIEKNSDLRAKISLNETADDSMYLPYLISVKINGQDAAADKYEYISSGDNAGNFTISKANLTGDVVITAEADKTAKSVGDYARQYVNGDKLEFNFSVPNGQYIVRALPDDDSILDLWYVNASGEEKKAEVAYYLNVTSPIEKVFFKKPDGTSINNYVTAAVVQLVASGLNTRTSTFTLNKNYNKKGVAFAYGTQLVDSKGKTNDLKITPLIRKGADCLADSPKSLTKLLPSPLIYNSTFSETVMQKKTADGKNYYIANKEKSIDAGKDYYFLGYFDNIPENGSTLEISSILNDTDQFNLKNNASEHHVYIKSNTKPNSSCYAFNNFDTPIVGAYDADTFNELVLDRQDGHTFISGDSDYSYVAYKLKTNESLSGYNIYQYSPSVKNKSITLSSQYRNQEIILGPEIENNSPIYTTNADENGCYTHVIKITSNNSLVKDNTSIYAHTTEFSKDQSSKLVTIKFKHILTVDNDQYYAPSEVCDGNVEIKENYIQSKNNPESITLDKVAVSFNDKVNDGDKMTFQPYMPFSVTANDAESSLVTYSNIGGYSYKNAFVGVPYRCKISVKSELRKDLTMDQIKVIYSDDGSDVQNATYQNGILSFTPIKPQNISITAEPISKSTTLSFNGEIACCKFLNSDHGTLYAIPDTGDGKNKITLVPEEGYTADISLGNKDKLQIYNYQLMTPSYIPCEGIEMDSSNNVVLTYRALNKSDVALSWNFTSDAMTNLNAIFHK